MVDAQLARRDAARLVFSTVPMLILVWIMYTGYKLTTEIRRYPDFSDAKPDNHYAFLFGTVTVVFGLVYFTIGLCVVAGLALDLLAWLQEDTKPGKNLEVYKGAEKKNEKTRQVVVRIISAVITTTLLMWAIYYGYKTISEPQKEGRYSRLAFLVGVINIAFGLIYFLLGIAIVAESALNLSDQLLQQAMEYRDENQEDCTLRTDYGMCRYNLVGLDP